VGLFDILGKNKGESKEQEIAFEKQVIETSNLSKEIDEIAQKYGISAKTLDFKILSYKTYYKKIDSSRYRELQEIKKDLFFKEDNLRNPKLEILQKLKVEIYEKNSSKFPIKIAVGANKNFTKVVARFQPQDNVNYFDGLEGEILSELDKRKAKQGILLGCFDEELRGEVKKLVSSIRVNKKIEETTTITICQAYELQTDRVGEVLYKFKEKEIDDTKKVDHSDKAFMHTVKDGDVIIEIVQSKKGKAGRDCRGALMPIKEVELSKNTVSVEVSEDIECIEKDDKVIYVAKRSGFINEIEPNKFEISDELIINEVSFKTTGSIDAGHDKDIKINIESKDSMTDAIGAGVHIETSEVKAEGNVGNGASVRADVIEIGGQTHQSAKLYGGDVSVNLHRGYVEGETIKIDLLEGGVVEGDIVHIKKAAGGEIRAKEVYLETVLSNVLVYASHYIEIDKVEGTGNKFIIDAKAQRGFDKKVEAIEEEIKQTQTNIEKVIKQIKFIKKKIHSEKETTQKIYLRIKELAEARTKPPASLVAKMRENQNRIKEHNLLLKELKDAKIHNETLTEDMKNIQSSVFDAKVVNKSTWREFNEVTFKIIEPPVSAMHLLHDGEVAREITLKALEDGEFTLNRKG
jgi:hypothetical protein